MEGGEADVRDTELEGAALVAVRTLEEHPELNTPEAIADHPATPDQFGAPEIRIGLQEAEAHDPPLVIRTGRTWILHP